MPEPEELKKDELVEPTNTEGGAAVQEGAGAEPTTPPVEPTEQVPEQKPEDIESLKAELAQKNEILEKITEHIKTQPVFAAVLKDMLDGNDFLVALLKYVDPEELQAMEDDPDYEAKAGAIEDRKKTLADIEARNQEIDSNVEKAQQVITSWSEKKGHDKEKTVEFLDWVDGLFADIQRANIEEGTLDRMWKAWVYEEDVDQAGKAGEIKGRNANIDAKKMKKSEQKGDGLPDLQSSGGAPKDKPKKKYALDGFSALDEKEEF